jgi:hypothetical protein
MIYQSKGRHYVRPSHGIKRYLHSLGRDILNGIVIGWFKVADS